MNNLFRDKYKNSLLKVSDILDDYTWGLSSSGALKFYGLEVEPRDIDVYMPVKDFENLLDEREDEPVRNVTEDYDVYILPLTIDKVKVEIGSGGKIGSGVFIFDEEMTERLEYFDLYGKSIPVLSLEDNLIIKTMLDRNKDREMLRNLNPEKEVNYEYINRRMEKFGYKEEDVRKLKKILG